MNPLPEAEPTMPRTRRSSRNREDAQRPPAPVRAGISLATAIAPGLAARALAELCMRPPRHRVPAQERDALGGLEPFAARHPGGLVRGWQRGHGPAVLLLHGWGGRSGQMAPLAQALASAGCTAVAIDAPGHGQSSGRVASVPLYAGAIAAAAHALSARAAIGHSFGGSALTFAVAQGLALDAAVVVGSPATPAVYVDQFCEALDLGLRARRALRVRLEERVGRRFEELELTRTIGAARSPALVVHDRADREVPFANAEALARAWPGARLHATSGLGHRRILRDPAAIRDMVAFVVDRFPRCACGRLAVRAGPGCPRCEDCSLSEDLWSREARWVDQPPSAALFTGS
jgi:pimeloyl-ACP methyl ester carboxylesterase